MNAPAFATLRGRNPHAAEPRDGLAEGGAAAARTGVRGEKAVALDRVRATELVRGDEVAAAGRGLEPGRAVLFDHRQVRTPELAWPPPRRSNCCHPSASLRLSHRPSVRGGWVQLSGSAPVVAQLAGGRVEAEGRDPHTCRRPQPTRQQGDPFLSRGRESSRRGRSRSSRRARAWPRRVWRARVSATRGGRTGVPGPDPAELAWLISGVRADVRPLRPEPRAGRGRGVGGEAAGELPAEGREPAVGVASGHGRL